MIDRRSVLQLGAAGVAAALAPAAVQLSAPTGAVARAVFDGRYDPSRVFAAELEDRGVATSDIGAHLAALWYGDLRNYLRETALPFAGLTDRAALFCFEELARDVGMKVRYRIDWTCAPGAGAWYQASDPLANTAAARCLATENNLGRAMARLVSEVDGRQSRSLTAQKRTGPFGAHHGNALVAWVIA